MRISNDNPGFFSTGSHPWVTITIPNDLLGIMNYRNRPFLMLCMERNETYHEQLDIIKNVAASYHDILTVCMISEEFLERFSQRYDVKGTPTFLFYRNGKERDRILGFTDRESLIAFLTRNLQSNYQTT